ncbi:protein bric-a-brac 2-like [Cimex lectularius]|uniref:Uncharacterized protein n=1 Tax=Cimex lectularius TaxID=79782 RepID=A0A8I6TFZ4_CIMLE|nr:protein bric-a-brac 2-like [Cimex lectularius]
MGCNQQFSLRWNNYLQHITHVFNSLRDEENLVDVTLCCEGKKIRAHKMLLSACSTYFRDIFKENPCQHPVVIFRNVKYDDLEALVSFMYKGEVNVEQDGLSSFLSTAELLEVKGLTGSGPCIPETIVKDDVSNNEPKQTSKQSSMPKTTKPDSPASKKRKIISSDDSPPPQIKAEPDFGDQDYYDNQTQGSPSPEILKTENLDVPWDDSINDLGSTAGTSNDSNLQDSLQVLANGLWRRLHPSLKRFGCDECGKVFKHPRSLDHHKKMHEGRTTCPFCRRVFGRMYALRLHMSSSHPGQSMLQSTKSH